MDVLIKKKSVSKSNQLHPRLERAYDASRRKRTLARCSHIVEYWSIARIVELFFSRKETLQSKTSLYSQAAEAWKVAARSDSESDECRRKGFESDNV